MLRSVVVAHYSHLSPEPPHPLEHATHCSGGRKRAQLPSGPAIVVLFGCGAPGMARGGSFGAARPPDNPVRSISKLKKKAPAEQLSETTSLPWRFNFLAEIHFNNKCTNCQWRAINAMGQVILNRLCVGWYTWPMHFQGRYTTSLILCSMTIGLPSSMMNRLHPTYFRLCSSLNFSLPH